MLERFYEPHPPRYNKEARLYQKLSTRFCPLSIHLTSFAGCALNDLIQSVGEGILVKHTDSAIKSLGL